MPNPRIPGPSRSGRVPSSAKVAPELVDNVTGRLMILDRIESALNARCLELTQMNNKLLSAIEGWRRLCDGQVAELKALRLAAFLVDDPRTIVGQLRAEVAEYRTAAAQAEHEKVLLEDADVAMRKELKERDEEINMLKKAPKAQRGRANLQQAAFPLEVRGVPDEQSKANISAITPGPGSFRRFMQSWFR